MSVVVGILGRPNVGKSTLFNTLTSSRDALVLDQEGVTRDVQYGECRLEPDKPFSVIDTAGLMFGAGTNDRSDNENIHDVVTQMSWSVVDDCDVIFWVVDGAAGRTAIDQALATRLREFSDRVVVCVNKVDGDEQSWALADFYGLGFAHVLALSALYDRGIKALVAYVTSRMEALGTLPAADYDEQAGIRFTLLGRPNVGKSTLTNQVLREDRVVVYDQPGTTRDCVAIPCQFRGLPYIVVDTAGMRRRSQIDELVEKYSVVQTIKAVAQADVVVVMLDAAEGVVEQDMRLLNYALTAGKALVLALNKWDLLDADAQVALKNDMDRRLGFVDFVEKVMLSAQRGKGISALFKCIDRAHESANKELSTAKVNDVLQEAVAKHAPPVMGRHRIKLRYAHVADHQPPMIVIHGNQTEKLPESYRRYLIRCFREAFKLIGTPLRLSFKSSDNPFKDKKNTLTARQLAKRQRLMKKVKS